MLRRNLDVADGLANGVLGTVVDFEMCNGSSNGPERVSAIWVKFDNKRVSSPSTNGCS